jgi:hypothetical protein
MEIHSGPLHTRDWEPVTIYTSSTLIGGQRRSRSKFPTSHYTWRTNWVGLTQNRETVALRTLTTVGLFYFIMCEDPAWIEIHWNSIWLRARSHMTSHYMWGSVTTPHDFGGVVGWPSNAFFWVLTTSWSRLLASVWSGALNTRADDFRGASHYGRRSRGCRFPPIKFHQPRVWPLDPSY